MKTIQRILSFSRVLMDALKKEIASLKAENQKLRDQLLKCWACGDDCSVKCQVCNFPAHCLHCEAGRDIEECDSCKRDCCTTCSQNRFCNECETVRCRECAPRDILECQECNQWWCSNCFSKDNTKCPSCEKFICIYCREDHTPQCPPRKCQNCDKKIEEPDGPCRNFCYSCYLSRQEAAAEGTLKWTSKSVCMVCWRSFPIRTRHKPVCWDCQRGPTGEIVISPF